MTGALEIIQGDRARWQRQAAGELARILDAHPGPPAIACTVGPAGCVLAGRVRDVFDAWRAALALEENREHQLGGGTTWLHAAARRHQVRVRLTAIVFAGEEDDR